jgi:tetratricopeptide (TPR) repeat protein
MTERCSRTAQFPNLSGRVAVLALVAIGLASNALRAQQAPADVVAPTIRLPVFEQLAEAQTCLEQDDIDCATSLVDRLAAVPDLNTYETAQLHLFYAFIFEAQDEFDRAIESYEAILALPADELPAGVIDRASQNLAALVRQARNALALKGIYRFGDVYEVSLQLEFGSVYRVTWKSGRSDAVPVANGYLVESIDRRTVTLGLPEDRNCLEDFQHVGTCISERQIVLSLAD